MGAWARLAMLLALIAATGAVYWLGYTNGKAAQAEAQQEAIQELTEAQAKAVDALKEEQLKREHQLRSKVRTIYVEEDSTGCADAPALNGVLEGLRTNTD